MQLPAELQDAIETLAESHNLKSLIQGREAVSSDYRKGADSKRAFRDDAQLLSYLITRFPATYAVCCKVFDEIRQRLPMMSVGSVLDLGSGPGSASWAAIQCFGSIELYLIEREREAIEVGKRLGEVSGSFGRASWTLGSLEEPFSIPGVDVAILSYVLGEMSLEASRKVVDRLWESSVPIVVLIEPGTPRGYQRIIDLRDRAIEKGARVVAPCPHGMKCPMSGGDWCHFAARVERSRLHRKLKGGTLGFEDEKYSYVVLAKGEVPSIEGRVVGRPLKGSGHVKLPMCASDGTLKEIVVTRSDKKKYRDARDAEWGSAWM